MPERYSSNGKLLLTAEYLVLKGAKALAVPVKYMQWMDVVTETGNNILQWEAKNQGKTWFYAEINKNNYDVINTTDIEKAKFLINIIISARGLNKYFISENKTYRITTDTNFPIDWGLGTSSTLIVNLAKWAKIDPYDLFFKISDGSGYDIACALSDKPLIYEVNNKIPKTERIDFYPSFSNNIFFVYTGKKQDTRINIESFLKETEILKCDIITANRLTDQFIKCKDINSFKSLLKDHENMLSYILKTPPVKHNFTDFEGEMKSLGAWGGDFILVTWEKSFDELKEYFSDKKLAIIIPYKEMVL